MTESASGAPNGLDERGLPRGYTFRPEWEITPREVTALREGGTRIEFVDVRTEQERALCRIEPSLHLPLHDLERRFDDLRDRLDEGGRAMIVVHCHHGMRSLRATALLRAAGFDDVHSLAGGIDLWSVDIDRDIPRY